MFTVLGNRLWQRREGNFLSFHWRLETSQSGMIARFCFKPENCLQKIYYSCFIPYVGLFSASTHHFSSLCSYGSLRLASPFLGCQMSTLAWEGVSEVHCSNSRWLCRTYNLPEYRNNNITQLQKYTDKVHSLK